MMTADGTGDEKITLEGLPEGYRYEFMHVNVDTTAPDEDDVPEPVKKDRLSRMIEVFKRRQMERQIEEIGRIHEVLVDKRGREEGQLSGLTDTNKRVILSNDGCQIGDMIKAKVTHVGQNTLFVEKI